MRYIHINIGMMLCLSAFLLACGTNNTGGSANLAAGMVTISGIVADGPIAGGTVTVTDAKGIILAVGKTDHTGAYHIAVPNNAALPLEVRISGGVDLVSNQKQGFPLLTLVTQPISNITQINANANAFTTIITTSAKAEALAQGVTLNPSILGNTTAKVVANLGFGLDPAFDPIHTPITASNTADINQANEALSEFIRRTSVDKVNRDNAAAVATAKVTNTSALPQQVNTNDMQSVIAMLAADVSDGLLDGYTSNKAVLNAAVSEAVQQGITPPDAVEVQSMSVLAQVNMLEVLAEVLNNRLKITNTAGAVVINAQTTQANIDKYAALSAGLQWGSAAANKIRVANIDASKSAKFFKKQIAVAIATAKTAIVNNDAYSASNKIQNAILQNQQLDTLQNSMIRLITAQTEQAAGTLTQAQVDLYARTLRTQSDQYANAINATRIDALTTATVQLMPSRMQKKILAISGLNAPNAQVQQAKNEAALQIATVIMPKVMQNTLLAQTQGNANLLINTQITTLTVSSVVQKIDANMALAQQAAFAAGTANAAVLHNAISLTQNIINIQDYNIAGIALAPMQATGYVVGEVMNLALPTLNAGNASNLAKGNVLGKKQLLYFSIASLPPIGSKGVATVQVIVKDDTTRGSSPASGRLSGERYAQSSFVINWEIIRDALGNTQLLIVGAAGNARNNYISSAGSTIVNVSQSNTSANIFSVSSILQPTGTLDTKMVISFASLFTSVATSIPGLANLRVVGSYFYWINIQGLPMRDMNGNLFTTIQGTLTFK